MDDADFLMTKAEYIDFGIFDSGENDRERCGVIIRKDERIYLIEVANSHEDAEHFARISNQSADDAVKITGGGTIIGLVHTHIDPKLDGPSDFDIAALPGELTGIIYIPATKDVHWYDRYGIFEPLLEAPVQEAVLFSERQASLAMAVAFHGLSCLANNAVPSKVDTVITTAKAFHKYLTESP